MTMIYVRLILALPVVVITFLMSAMIVMPAPQIHAIEAPAFLYFSFATMGIYAQRTPA